jgi:hypothetical protein
VVTGEPYQKPLESFLAPAAPLPMGVGWPSVPLALRLVLDAGRPPADITELWSRYWLPAALAAPPEPNPSDRIQAAATTKTTNRESVTIWRDMFRLTSFGENALARVGARRHWIESQSVGSAAPRLVTTPSRHFLYMTLEPRAA